MPRKKSEKTEEIIEETSEVVETEKEQKNKSKKVEKKKLTEAEFEKKVLELAKSGLTSEKIGEKLRQEGIHPAEHGKKISRILKEKNLYVNPDLTNVKKKLERIQSHYSKNKQDKKAMREKDRVFAQERKLVMYHNKKLK